MTMNGVIAHKEAFGYRLIVQPSGNELKDLDFTLCQTAVRSPRLDVVVNVR